MQASAVMQDHQSADAAAKELAGFLRQCKRNDVHERILRGAGEPASVHGDSTSEPYATIESHMGPSLLAAVNRIQLGLTQPDSAYMATAVIRQLDFCDALLLGRPFATEALRRHLIETDGVLDLTPPLVPVHNSIDLLALTSLLEVPLRELQEGPTLTQVHVAAHALAHLPKTGAGPANLRDPLEPIADSLKSTTILRFTNGIQQTPATLLSEQVVQVQRYFPPDNLFHLVIDANIHLPTPLRQSLSCTFPRAQLCA